jgi:hypothetical protein
MSTSPVFGQFVRPTVHQAGHTPHPFGIAKMSAMNKPLSNMSNAACPAYAEHAHPLYDFLELIRTLESDLVGRSVRKVKVSTHELRFAPDVNVVVSSTASTVVLSDWT